MINMMFEDLGRRRATLNRLCRAQLESTKEALAYYLEKDEMPHEWGSIDSYSHMTCSLVIAGELMSALLSDVDPNSGVDVDTDEGVKKFVQKLADSNMLGAFAAEVYDFAGLETYVEERMASD